MKNNNLLLSEEQQKILERVKFYLRIKKEIGRIGVESRKSLKELLESLAAAYYYDEPLVSDKVYEELLDYYNSMEKAYGKKNFSGIDKTNSKREKIKYSNTKLLFTLSKQKDMEEFKEWEKKIRSNKLLNNELGSKNLSNEFIITPKYDGNSFGVQYRYSKKNDKVIVVKVITRGKDNEGLDYTDDLKELFKIDLSKSKPLRKIILSNSIINFEIQYEIVMTKSNLDVYNKAINASYKNCRSVLNSILKRDEFSKYIQYLDFVPLNFHNDKEYILYDKKAQLQLFENIHWVNSNIPVDLKEYATSLELEQSDEKIINMIPYSIAKDINEIEKIYKQYQIKRDYFNYLIDGIVIELKSPLKRELLGYAKYGDNHEPQFTTALKFKAEEKFVKIKDIVFEIGLSGRYTPMAVFDKTKLNNGVEYTKVSLSSYKNLKEKDFRVGEMVILQYRHDTLGYIEKDPSFNNEHLPKTKFIKNCLYCGEPIKLNDSKNLAFCVNKDCDGLKIGKIVAFINNIKLKGIEFQKVESLFKYGYIKSIKSLFTIKESKKLEITKEKGWGNKSVENFFEIINSRNNDMTDYELLGSMSIETIGREMALEFCKKFHLFEFLTSFNYENKEKYITQITETNKVKGFSNIRAEHIIDGINENLNLIIYLLTRVYRNCKYSYDEYKNKKQSDKIYNLVITGDIPGLNREEVIRKLKDLGHTVTNKISGKTNYLVCNDKASGTTKVQDAIKFGVEIITSDKLFSLLEIKEENEYEKSKNRAVGVKF